MLKAWLAALLAENSVRCGGTPHAPAPTRPGAGEFSLGNWHGRTIPYPGLICQNKGYPGVLLPRASYIAQFRPARINALVAVAIRIFGNFLPAIRAEAKTLFRAMRLQRQF